MKQMTFKNLNPLSNSFKGLAFVAFLAVSILFGACEKEEPAPIADFTFQVDKFDVQFNAQVQNVETYDWSFGDSNSSTDVAPMHTYNDPGTYTVTLIATGKGGSITVSKDVTIDESIEYLLTGGPGSAGKSWGAKRLYTIGEGAGLVHSDLPEVFLPSADNVLEVSGLGAGYNHEFTFSYDGSYKMDNKNGESLMGLLYASVTVPDDIRAISNDVEVPLVLAAYTPASGSTWQLSTNDVTIPAINPLTGTPEDVTFTKNDNWVAQLITSEYFLYKDFTSYVFIKEINADEMQLAVTLHAAEAAPDRATFLFHLTVESK
ncbi:MAG: PKD domain-containing protein [Bacteroidetes bacterium]|nr:PKD domain-containing protein [Bacteroidota bacterium]